MTNRKSFPLNFFICIFIVLLTMSCEKENKLTDSYVLNKIEIFNLTLDELNNMTIIAYKKNSDFSKVVDSTYVIEEFIQIDVPYYNFMAYLNKDINTDLDYKFSFLSSGLSCEITDIKVKKYGSVFAGFSRSFDGYKVNGENFACQIIKVFPE